jgi:hypothetical protein
VASSDSDSDDERPKTFEELPTDDSESDDDDDAGEEDEEDEEEDSGEERDYNNASNGSDESDESGDEHDSDSGASSLAEEDNTNMSLAERVAANAQVGRVRKREITLTHDDTTLSKFKRKLNELKKDGGGGESKKKSKHAVTEQGNDRKTFYKVGKTGLGNNGGAGLKSTFRTKGKLHTCGVCFARRST